ncbi:MAG: AAA family ATPase [Candidatus Dormibacteria bacterium]
MVLQGNRVEREAGRLSSSSTLVGRDRELRLLVDTIERPPAVIFVEGEAGVGKSRLVADFCDATALNRDRILIGRCHPQRHPFLLEPVVEALGGAAPLLLGRRLPPVAGALRSLLPELSEMLPPAPEPSEDGHAEGHQLFRALREVITALGPTVLVLEDVQWADDTTGDLLHFLLTVPPPQLSLLLTYRPEDMPETAPIRALAGRGVAGVASEHIVLEPLDAGDVAALIAAILEVDGVSEEFATFLHSRTGGVPFAVEEVLRLLQDRRDLVRQNGRWARRQLDRIEVPNAVRDAVLERLSRLSPDTRKLVSAAAVFAMPVAEDQLSQVASVASEAIADALTEAIQSGLLREDDQARSEFRHELARQAVHEAIPAPQRRRFHLRAAQLLEAAGRSSAATIAHHYREAGRLDDWVRHAETAAGQTAALERTDSCRILQDLQASPSLPLPVRVRLAAKLGHEPHLGLAQQGAVDVVRRVLEDETDPRPRGELRLLLGHALIDAGDGTAGREELAQAIAELGPQSPMSANAVMTLADPSATEGSLDAHVRWLDRALEIAAATPDPAVKLAVLANRASVLATVGDPAAWEAVAEIPRRWGTVGERREAAAGLASVAVGASYTGYYQRARDLLTEATAVVEKFDCAHVLASHDAIHLMLDWTTGTWTGLEERARVLLEQREPGPPRPSPERLVLNLLRLVSAGPETSRQGLEEALDMALRAGVAPGHAVAAGALARCHIAAQSPAAALHVAQGALEMIRRKGIWVWATEVAPPAVQSLIDLDRADEAATLAAELRTGLAGRDAPAAEAALTFCQGMVDEATGRREAAIQLYEIAHSRWSALPRPYDAALAQERWGMAVLETDHERGAELMASAHTALEELGADWQAARVRQLLRRHGAAPMRRGGRGTYGNALSPREQEILELVEQGITYRQIAERLFLSERTVESHVRRVRAKRDVGRPVRGRTVGMVAPGR